MTWDAIRKALIPGKDSQDEGFEQEILRLSHNGLRAMAGITFGAPLIMLIGWMLILPDAVSLSARIVTNLIVATIGVVQYLLSRLSWVYSRSRLVALVMANITCAVLISSSLYLSGVYTAAEDFIPSQLTLVVLVAAVALPLKPIHTLMHAATVAFIYWAVIEIASQTFVPGAVTQADYYVFMVMLTLLCVGLSATLYAERRNAYRAYMETLRAFGELRQAQQRLVLSEAASSTARLAAAISHELNTPVGALKSGVDTLLALAARQATAPPEQLPRLLMLQAELRRSIQDSANRLQQLAARFARFTNLDQSEVQHTKINDLVSDVTELLRSRIHPGTGLDLDLAPIPEIVGNPQQLSAVFYDLINNSLGALNGNGSVGIRTRRRPDGVEVQIEDNGRGIEQQRLDSIFEPGFQETSGRVASANWSMFSARQIVREHGGDIAIESRAGAGTKVTISLPFGRLT